MIVTPSPHAWAQDIGRAASVAATRLAPGELAVLTVGLANPVNPLALWRLTAAKRTYWRSTRAAEVDTSVATLGQAALLTASGEERFDSIKEQATTLFSKLRYFTPHGEERPTLPAALFGGFAFGSNQRQGAEASEDWEQFGASTFLLPRWTVSPHSLRLVLSKEELRERAPLTAELTEVARALESPVALPRSSLSLRQTLREAPLPRGKSYPEGVEAALDIIARGSLKKVVLARALLLERETPIVPLELLARADEPDSLHFALEFAPQLFVGQSPERLLGVRGRELAADALAGSCGAESNGALLLANEKELREHALVRDWLITALSRVGEVRAAASPGIRHFRTVQHLATSVEANAREPHHLLELAKALHPTPALGGDPRAGALRLITELEGDSRGWYGGLVGWFDETGSGELWVAIRSALVDGNKARLFAGAGIVAGSAPKLELAETTAKAASALRLFGVTP